MSDPSLAPFTPMGIASVQAIMDLPGVLLLARDLSFRLLWCNPGYAKMCGRESAEEMLGTTMADFMPAAQAEDRASLMRRVQEDGHMVAYQQLWEGARWITLVWPLDEQEFNQPGYFVMITRLGSVHEGMSGALWSSSLELVKSPHLGEELGKLSTRELEVFYWLATGLTQAEVAAMLHRSPKTIATHAENLHRKMGFTSRAELVRYAVERGIVHFTGEEWTELIEGKRI